MFSTRFPISICAASLLAASAAHAADIPQPLPQPIIEEFSAWYLRGDIGFSNQRVRNFFVSQGVGVDTEFPGVAHVDKGFDSAPFFGLGIGYNFNDWLRFDATGEFRGKANFHAFDTAPNGGGLIDDRSTASKSEWTVLLNGYVDLGTWYNVTPFVGAGVGFSRNTISSFGDISACTNSSGCAGSGGSDGFAPEASKWNLAWALHAGLAYKVTKNFTVELAYRYIDLGDAITGNVTSFDGATTLGPAHFQHLTSHDVKLGVRFNLDSLSERSRPVQYYQQPQAYTPPPVYKTPQRSKG